MLCHRLGVRRQSTRPVRLPQSRSYGASRGCGSSACGELRCRRLRGLCFVRLFSNRSLNLGFTLSLRDIEDLLADRGIAVSYETARRWENHFGPMIAANLLKRRPRPYAVWHLDEVYLKIDGRMV